MNDPDLVAFLQWALPRLGLRWPGFRKVRGRVRKKLNDRCRELDLPDIGAYRHYLVFHPGEWAVLDGLCRITISRFHRDRAVFDHLRHVVLPGLAQRATDHHEGQVRCWSAGCASGEEPYSLMILWALGLPGGLARVPLRVIATDVDEHLLGRARVGCYGAGSLKELPPQWRARAFSRVEDQYRVRDEFREGVEFHRQDIREAMPDGQFHLILCRNLAFTYFDEHRQREVLWRVVERLVAGGYLVVGAHESIPGGVSNLVGYPGSPDFYRRPGDAPPTGP